MVKQKHHTARNQSIKNHKNGIKRPQRQRARCMKGVGIDLTMWFSRLIPSSLETFASPRSTIRRNTPLFDAIRGTVYALFVFIHLSMSYFDYMNSVVLWIDHLFSQLSVEGTGNVIVYHPYTGTNGRRPLMDRVVISLARIVAQMKTMKTLKTSQ